MADAKNMSPGVSPQGRGGPQGFKLVGFPKEFERSFWEVFDKRYYAILLVTWVVLYAFTFFMSSRAWQISEMEKQRIKRSYLQQLYTEIVVPEEPAAGEGEEQLTVGHNAERHGPRGREIVGVAPARPRTP